MNDDYGMGGIWDFLRQRGIFCCYSGHTFDTIKLSKLDKVLNFNGAWQLEIFLKRMCREDGNFLSILAEKL